MGIGVIISFQHKARISHPYRWPMEKISTFGPKRSFEESRIKKDTSKFTKHLPKSILSLYVWALTLS